jgi:cell wall-associated NlpC family hydrolase
MNRRSVKFLPIVLALMVMTGGALFAPVTAQAAPVDDLQAQATQLEQQINQNQEKLGALNEQINSAQNDLDASIAQIKQADAFVAAAKAKTSELKAEVARRAAAVYMQSGTSGGVADLDAQNAQDLSSKQKYTSLAAQRDDEIVNQLRNAKEEVAARKVEAVKARDAAQKQRDEIQAQKDELSAGQAKLEALQSQVKGQIADLVAKAEAERQAREAAAAQAQYKLPAPLPTNQGPTPTPPTPPPSSGNVGAVMAYAYAQLGKPYCYAGAGPDCFDCSGLSMMAWAQAGVSMPHGSYAQQAMFPAVSMNDLQVGDLVFWDGHVGIYVGGGAVLHAPHTGTVVQITPIWSGVIGAARPG